MAIPAFTPEGLLPALDIPATLDEIRVSHLVTGQGNPSQAWDSAWRRELVENLAILVGQLWQVGITEIYVDGSFVENKDHPNDIDGYFECELRRVASGDLERDLNALDPHKVWTWAPRSRRPARNSAKAQLPMWHRYRVELYPHVGLPSGIRDRFGNDLLFPAAFRRTRGDNRAKGILKIVR